MGKRVFYLLKLPAGIYREHMKTTAELIVEAETAVDAFKSKIDSNEAVTRDEIRKTSWLVSGLLTGLQSRGEKDFNVRLQPRNDDEAAAYQRVIDKGLSLTIRAGLALDKKERLTAATENKELLSFVATKAENFDEARLRWNGDRESRSTLWNTDGRTIGSLASLLKIDDMKTLNETLLKLIGLGLIHSDDIPTIELEGTRVVGTGETQNISISQEGLFIFWEVLDKTEGAPQAA